MKINFQIIIALSLLVFSCQDDTKRDAAQKKDIQKKEAVFAVVEKNWNFNVPPLDPQTQNLVAGWAEWRLFLTELTQKPKNSIGAFQQKARTLTQKATALNNNIPAKFAKPEVKARISALITKIRSLDLYINLDDIPADKTTVLVAEINATLASLSAQLQEIVRIGQIPTEQGESDMIRMLDTARAIPSVPKTKTPLPH